MTQRTPAKRAELIFLAASALLAPSLSLVVLGGLFLWQTGYLLIWSLACAFVILAVVSIQALLLRRAAPASVALELPTPVGTGSSEDKATVAVAKIAARARIDDLIDQDRAWALTSETITAVAEVYHPGHASAVWRFTVPEALAISEQVSRRLGRFITETVPFGDRLTVAQMLTLYRARGLVDVAGRAYDLWRLVRLANPAAAAAAEVRERLTKAIVAWGQDEVSRRIVQRYVEEVGRAAIDLYRGRLDQVHDGPLTPSEPTDPASASLLDRLRRALFSRAS
jgi:hypothetical protein